MISNSKVVKQRSPRKTAAQKRAEKHAQFANIPEATRDALIKAIMDFPQGCDSGKREFLEEIGWPVPPKRTMVALAFYVDVPSELIDEDMLTPKGDQWMDRVGNQMAAVSEFDVEYGYVYSVEDC